jgi:acyl carrier protein
MTRGEFLWELECQLDLPKDSLHENRSLSDVEGWDSMASIMFIALADDKLGANISGNQIAKSKTVKELLSLLSNRLTG